MQHALVMSVDHVVRLQRYRDTTIYVTARVQQITEFSETECIQHCVTKHAATVNCGRSEQRI